MRLLRTVSGIACLVPALGHGAESDALVARALAHYHAGAFAAAYREFSAAADAGNVRAQEMAGFMGLAGPSVYTGVPREPGTAMHRLQQAADSGSGIARAVACTEARRLGLRRYPPCDAR